MYATHKLYMQLLQQNWYVVRLVPPTDPLVWAPSGFRWLIVCGLVFYGNFQRRLPHEPAPAELLASKQGKGIEWD